MLHPQGREGIYEIIDNHIMKNGRRYYSVVCDNGHSNMIRSDAFERQKFTCKFCNSQPMYKTATYNSWDSMKQRCTNPKNRRWKHYGGRGISYDSRWEFFENFLEDMGECPEGLTLDRIDVNGNYCKENCRWATDSVQGYNQTKRCTNTSGRTGVHWDKKNKKFYAKITVNSTGIFLGYYENFDDAVHARREAELKYFGFTRDGNDGN